jgi:uncharacterized protein (TIGR03067 family)
MTKYMLWSFATGCFFAAAAADGDGKDLVRLQGVWSRVSALVDGKERPADELRKQQITIVEDTYTLTVNGTLRRGQVILDPCARPRTIDFLSTEGPNKGKVLKGIYEIEGDTFTYCIALPGKDRPTALGSQPGSGHLLFRNQREKP